MPTITITVFERECHADDFDSENGIGIPEHVKPREVHTTIIACSPYVSPDGIERMVAESLCGLGFGEWDGGNTAYDPDGSSMAPDGTITERFARIER